MDLNHPDVDVVYRNRTFVVTVARKGLAEVNPPAVHMVPALPSFSVSLEVGPSGGESGFILIRIILIALKLTVNHG